VQLARRHTAVCLAGNHDLAVVGEIPVEDFSRGASLAVQWTQEVIAAESLEFLVTLRPSGSEGAVGLYHGSPRDPVWEYVLSVLLAELCLDAQAERVSLVGHSHIALSFDRAEGRVASGEVRRGDSEVNIAQGKWLLNPGSVGQPRDGDPRAAWMLLDLDDETAHFHRCEYDIEGAAAAIRAARLPDSLAERLEFGQ
jgi:diadenosine tetraphosphatase ApaH/serine/threonine PP2A family protein phosphatase